VLDFDYVIYYPIMGIRMRGWGQRRALMSAGIWFWLLYVICVVFGGWLIWPAQDRRMFGSYGVIMILIGLLGWAVFGSPLK
jgi:hypothetical protein